MSQILSVASRAVRGKTGSRYEDLDGPNKGSSDGGRRGSNEGGDTMQGQELEMNSVSIVPDDTFTVGQAVNAFGFGKFQAKLSLFTGLCWMADSMEMTILSILSPALHCEWQITRYQQALTTTIVFMGMMLSSTFWGYVSDRYGRKQALTLCAVLLFYYGILSSLAPSYTWILFLKGLVGFAIGCVPQSVTLYAEFLPSKQRAKCVVLLDCFWALGACFEVLLALIVMPTLGWKWLLALSTAPLLAFACICPWLPESARFHVASGQPEKALATLRTIAADNGKPMLLGRLVVDDNTVGEHRGRVRDLLSVQLRTTSLLLWYIWTVCAFCYYGVVLMTTELFEASDTRCSEASMSGAGMFKPVETCTADCRQLNTQDYMDLLWTTLAEFPGIFATIFVIEKFGRKRTMAVQFVIFTACVSFLFICTQSRVYLTVTLFVARGIIAGVFQAAYVYTPEVYPTPLRAVGVGTCSAMARLGAMITPYIAQVLLKSSLSIAMTVYAVAALSAALACALLPFETKGKEMKETLNK
uniref:Synaptic vesicle 2-related protein n=1 Tax=Cacopsylla melanoneura TaxID=428564 RepID=A0A8D8Z508_9HEMI